MDQSQRRKGNKYKYAINNFSRFDTDDSLLDIDLKLSILKNSEYVVCLKSYSGDTDLFICSGVIMECESRLGTSFATILTSASLLRSPDGEPKLASNLKIDVYRVRGQSIEGKLMAFDFHYNVAIVEFRLDSPALLPDVRLVDNVVQVGLGVSHSISDREFSTSNRFRLYPGVKVLALARYFQEPYDIMVASGEIGCSSRLFGFDCKELLQATCKIKKNGIGGPLINLQGEVIGINFYEVSCTPFLPMNIVIKCFEDLKNIGHISHVSLGVLARDLYTTSLQNLENVCNKFPHVSKGAIIDKVLPDSSAYKAGLCANDAIINCSGASIGGCLELTETLWGNVGKPVELVVVRANTGEQLEIVLDALDANPRVNRWPVPKPRMMSSHPLHNLPLIW